MALSLGGIFGKKQQPTAPTQTNKVATDNQMDQILRETQAKTKEMYSESSSISSEARSPEQTQGGLAALMGGLNENFGAEDSATDGQSDQIQAQMQAEKDRYGTAGQMDQIRAETSAKIAEMTGEGGVTEAEQKREDYLGNRTEAQKAELQAKINDLMK